MIKNFFHNYSNKIIQIKPPIPNREIFKKFSHISNYKRPDSKIGINFLSKESKNLLSKCINQNTANPFFKLVDQYNTQADPAFCGATNLMIVLNTLQKDPKIKWKGIWRWYDEYNIKCINIENVLDYGLTLPEFSKLLQCNGVSSRIYRPFNNYNLYPRFNNKINEKLYDQIETYKQNAILHKKNCSTKNKKKIPFNISSLNFLRLCSLASVKYDNFILMFNLGRKSLGQTGDGHFTPIVAYDKKSDYGLVLDSARFKYNSRWFKLPTLYESLFKIDNFTQKSRGFLLIPSQNIKNIDFEISEGNKNNLIKNIILSNKNFFNEEDEKIKLIDFLMKNNIRGNYENIESNNIIKKYYFENKKFKDFIDFLYMFDRENVINNFIFTILNKNLILKI